MSVKANLSIDQGADFKTYFTLENTDGTPLDITDYTFQSEFRKYYTSATYINLTCAVEQATNGVFSVALGANSSANVDPGRYLYDVKMTDIANTITRVLEGILTLNAEVTK